MPIPKPNQSENESNFMARCIPAIIDEYGKEQAAAICIKKWKEKMNYQPKKRARIIKKK